jgi:acyl-CoA hydrolase
MEKVPMMVGKDVADYVVAEYGIAPLMGKMAPERASEVAIAVLISEPVCGS